MIIQLPPEVFDLRLTLLRVGYVPLPLYGKGRHPRRFSFRQQSRQRKDS